MGKLLTEADYQRASKKYNVEVAALKAVAKVEAPKGGFYRSGQPRILFEGHIFSRLTNRKYDKSHPKLSHRKWTRKFYKGSQHKRLQAAVLLDRDAALKSASWGKFQIMGFNFARCGTRTLQIFINKMYRSEYDQFQCFLAYLKSAGLMDELQRHDWTGFARIYNGPAFYRNSYDEKMARAYHKLRSVA